MPTPRDETAQLSPASPGANAQTSSSCPPDYDASMLSPSEEEDVNAHSSSPRAVLEIDKLSDNVEHGAHADADMLIEERDSGEEEGVLAARNCSSVSEPNTSTSLVVVPPDCDGSTHASTPSGIQEFSNIRVLPNYPSSLLRYGSKFVGIQKSDAQHYNVQVEIKHIDMTESSLCGYLRIDGLTPDHPTITTFFEGEIIGPKYSFFTRHAEWGATEKTDIQHWERFASFRPFAKQTRKADFRYTNVSQRENIFMRWKEKFLVPDYKVAEINGASFEGFYYICFNQITGAIEGYYFFAKSEKYQQLKLKHVPDRYCLGGMEFR